MGRSDCTAGAISTNFDSICLIGLTSIREAVWKDNSAGLLVSPNRAPPWGRRANCEQVGVATTLRHRDLGSFDRIAWAASTTEASLGLAQDLNGQK